MRRNADQQRRHRAATSAAMKRRAEALKCPACGRKSALQRVRDDRGFIVAVVCRWCKYEKARAE